MVAGAPSDTSAKLVEWLLLFVLAFAAMVWSWLTKAPAILKGSKKPTIKQIRRIHRRNRQSTMLSLIGLGCFFAAFALLAAYEGGNETKLNSGNSVRVEYARWLEITALMFFFTFAYASYAQVTTANLALLLVSVLAFTVSGIFATLSSYSTGLSTTFLVLGGLCMVAAAINGLRYHNIRVVGYGWNYFVWGVIFLHFPFFNYLFLHLSPETSHVLSRNQSDLAYLVINVFGSFLFLVISGLSFMGTKRLSVEVITEQTLDDYYKTTKKMAAVMDDEEQIKRVINCASVAHESRKQKKNKSKSKGGSRNKNH